MRTETAEYAERLVNSGDAPWKRLLNVQAPYQWNIRRHCLGRTLELGCGIGRNLGSLVTGSVGVDHNPVSVRVARERGFNAMTVTDFFGSELAEAEAFDTVLVAHVLEHMSYKESRQLLNSYLPFLRRNGLVFMVCPQERGYASDPTHVRWTDGRDLEKLAVELGLVPESWRSFPLLPRVAGRYFRYNEFTLLSQKP